MERLKNEEGYFPGNVVWASKKVQGRNMRTNYRVVWNGRKRVLRDLCDELGLHPGAVHGRLQLGWPLEKALMEPIQLRGPIASSFSGAIRALDPNANVESVRRRVKKMGWSLEMAVFEPPRNSSGLPDRCRAAGLDYSTVWRRIHKHGWTEERALSTPVQIGGFKTLCDSHGIRASTARERIKAGWTLEEALSTPAGQKRKPSSTPSP